MRQVEGLQVCQLGCDWGCGWQGLWVWPGIMGSCPPRAQQVAAGLAACRRGCDSGPSTQRGSWA